MARPKKNATVDLATAQVLTAGLVERLTCRTDVKTQAFLRDSVAPGLRVRVTNTGAKSFVFEAKLNRQTIRRTIGDVRAWRIEEARNEANRLRVSLDSGHDPRVVEREKHAVLAAAAATQLEAERYTFEKLLTAYCDHQQAIGRKSHADARSIFKLHVIGPWSDVAKLPANTVTSEQVADMMRRVIEVGKGRTANKLRSYVRAAYQVAKASRSKASIPVAFKLFNVKTNPASDTEPDESANKADKNPLRADEIRIYWNAIKPLDGFAGALLRLHLLTGGQRLEQFVNLLTIDASSESITLFDGKGRPGKPARPHVVPLIHDAVVALMECQPIGQFALSTDAGATHVSAATLSEWAMQAGAGIEGFQTKRIRSGVETLLASARISADHRGRLQSHGISGVQARHYDGHDYMDEKRHALDTLHSMLMTAPASNVVIFKSA
ncbi:MAG: integrase family protein [Rhodoferax sp.]|nr:integrase family protein [Rhodoferax sp.]